MFYENPDIHFTIAHRVIDAFGEGWEFECDQCGYRARYRADPFTQGQRLEIIDIGDPTIRHVDDQSQIDPIYDAIDNDRIDNQLSDPAVPDAVDFNEGPIDFDESWITPEIQSIFERILEKLDR